MAENAKWYVVHTYSGYENTVSASIQKAAENRHMEDLILEVRIPMETVTEHTDNGDKTYERKTFPGYVLVKMIMTDESWHLVRNARGSTGFVSMDGKPVPLTEAEVLDWAIPSRSRTVPSRVSSAQSTRSSRRRIASASLFPCSVGRRPSISSSIRSRPSNKTD